MALKTLKDYLSPGGQLPLESTEPEALEQFFQMQPETAEDVTPTDFPLAPLAPGKLSSMSLARPQAPRAARPTAIVAPPAPKALESGAGKAPALPPVTGEEAQYKAREDLARSQQGLERLAQRERVLKTLGIEPGKTRTRGALSLTGGATQFPITPEGEPTRVEVPTRQVNAKDGVTVTAPAGEGRPEAPTKVPVPGAGGDEGLDNLALGELITRGIGAVYQGATGRQVGGNIPEMLAAVRQRREAQAQREREIGAEQARSQADLAFREKALAAETQVKTASQALKDRMAGTDEESTKQRLEYAESVQSEDPAFARLLRAGPIRNNDFIRARKEWENAGLLRARTATEREKPAQVQATTELKRAQAERARFLSSPAGIAAARKVAEKEDAALEQARGGRFAGLGLTPSQQESATRAVAENRQQLSAKTAPFAETITALKNAEAAAAGLKEIKPSDVLKAKLPGGVGESLMSDEAKALQKAQQSLTDLILRARSGAAITEAEANRLTDLYGVKPFRSITDYKKGLKELKSLMYAKLNAAQSGFAPTGDIDVDRYAALEDLERGDPNFVSYRDPFFKDVGGTGKRVGAVAATGAKPRPSAAAIAKLQASIGTEQETSLKQAFDARYGEGAADKALGGK